MTATLEQSIKKRLQMVARERNMTPAVVWQNLIADRFLVRLCRSKYRSNFILKGGTLLARHLDIGRETRDLDFAVESLAKDVATLTEAMEAIIAIEIDDGFVFKSVKVESLSPFHMQYPGAQIKIDAAFGQTQFSLFIDLGFGDRVEGKEEKILLLGNSKGPLFEADVELICYPMEFVFAEKLETVIFRHADNTRMKDFHDLWTMASHPATLDRKRCAQAIEIVFAHRGTPKKLPIAFDQAALKALQINWERYRPSIPSPSHLPVSIEEVISLINSVSKVEGGDYGDTKS
jgi:predicted nucleotidyltransferase component of viral defense system